MTRQKLLTVIYTVLITGSLIVIGWQSKQLFFSDNDKDQKISEKKLTSFHPVNNTFNTGKVVAGDTAKAIFVLVNTGNEDLMIDDIEPECHCTVPIWDKSPIKPKDSITIYANVVEHNPIGPFTKLVTVISNTTTSPYTLSIRGNYIAKK